MSHLCVQHPQGERTHAVKNVLFDVLNSSLKARTPLGHGGKFMGAEGEAEGEPGQRPDGSAHRTKENHSISTRCMV